MLVQLNGGDPRAEIGESASKPRLVQAAHEFEGQMMKELLKPMTESDGLMGGDADENMGSGVLGDFATESLGQALSQRGGFGIANRIIDQLSHAGATIHEGTVTRKSN